MTEKYEKNKQYIKNWRDKNRKAHNKVTREWMKAHYVSKLDYSFDYQCRQFRAIRI